MKAFKQYLRFQILQYLTSFSDLEHNENLKELLPLTHHLQCLRGFQRLCVGLQTPLLEHSP